MRKVTTLFAINTNFSLRVFLLSDPTLFSIYRIIPSLFGQIILITLFHDLNDNFVRTSCKSVDDIVVHIFSWL